MKTSHLNEKYLLLDTASDYVLDLMQALANNCEMFDYHFQSKEVDGKRFSLVFTKEDTAKNTFQNRLVRTLNLFGNMNKPIEQLSDIQKKEIAFSYIEEAIAYLELAQATYSNSSGIIGEFDLNGDGNTYSFVLKKDGAKMYKRLAKQASKTKKIDPFDI